MLLKKLEIAVFSIVIFSLTTPSGFAGCPAYVGSSLERLENIDSRLDTLLRTLGVKEQPEEYKRKEELIENALPQLVQMHNDDLKKYKSFKVLQTGSTGPIKMYEDTFAIQIPSTTSTEGDRKQVTVFWQEHGKTQENKLNVKASRKIIQKIEEEEIRLNQSRARTWSSRSSDLVQEMSSLCFPFNYQELLEKGQTLDTQDHFVTEVNVDDLLYYAFLNDLIYTASDRHDQEKPGWWSWFWNWGAKPKTPETFTATRTHEANVATQLAVVESKLAALKNESREGQPVVVGGPQVAISLPSTASGADVSTAPPLVLSSQALAEYDLARRVSTSALHEVVRQFEKMNIKIKSCELSPSRKVLDVGACIQMFGGSGLGYTNPIATEVSTNLRAAVARTIAHLQVQQGYLLAEAKIVKSAAANLFVTESARHLSAPSDSPLSVNAFLLRNGNELSGVIMSTEGLDPSVRGTNPVKVLVVFAGSKSFSDWKENFNAWQSAKSATDRGTAETEKDSTRRRAHTGFMHLVTQSTSMENNPALESIMEKIEEALRAGKPVKMVFSGHSLGGPLSTLMAVDTKQQLQKRVPEGKLEVRNITFGSPRVYRGDDEVAAVEKVLGVTNILRIHAKWDPVPHLPFAMFGYKHVGTSISLRENSLAMFGFGEGQQLVPGFIPRLHNNSYHSMDLYYSKLKEATAALKERVQGPYLQLRAVWEILKLVKERKTRVCEIAQGLDFDTSQRAGSPTLACSRWPQLARVKQQDEKLTEWTRLLGSQGLSANEQGEIVDAQKTVIYSGKRWINPSAVDPSIRRDLAQKIQEMNAAREARKNWFSLVLGDVEQLRENSEEGSCYARYLNEIGAEIIPHTSLMTSTLGIPSKDGACLSDETGSDGSLSPVSELTSP